MLSSEYGIIFLFMLHYHFMVVMTVGDGDVTGFSEDIYPIHSLKGT